jgi:hypothetical protein
VAQPVPPIVCPTCRQPAARRIALFGSQLMTSQYRCDACGALFEAIRWPDDEPPEPADEQP